MQMRKCPRCGHNNVSRAIFCFQCGKNLDDPGFVRGMHGTGKLIEDALRFIKNRGQDLEPSMIEKLKEARAKVPPEDLIGEPMTCLRCGTYNVPIARNCIGCGLTLVVPDADFNLLPISNARTNVGQVRANNEDHVCLWAVDGIFLGVVADGLGGAQAGEEASRLAVEAIQAAFLGEPRGSNDLLFLSEKDLSNRMVTAILDANQAVFERAQSDHHFKGMGTTVTLALIRGNRVLVAHVGDSRAYLIDGEEGWINQITTDHSFVQALVASGHITPEQAIDHPMGSVLYRALGQSLDLDVDVFSRYLKAKDRLVLCSDGLTRHLKPEEIAYTVSTAHNPSEATEELIEQTNERGGEDNISVIVVMMQPVQEEQSV